MVRSVRRSNSNARRFPATNSLKLFLSKIPFRRWIIDTEIYNWQKKRVKLKIDSPVSAYTWFHPCHCSFSSFFFTSGKSLEEFMRGQRKLYAFNNVVPRKIFMGRAHLKVKKWMLSEKAVHALLKALYTRPKEHGRKFIKSIIRSWQDTANIPVLRLFAWSWTFLKRNIENVPGHVSLDIAFQDFAERFSRVNFDQRGYTRAPHIQPCKAFLARKNWNQLELVEQCREKKATNK